MGKCMVDDCQNPALGNRLFCALHSTYSDVSDVVTFRKGDVELTEQEKKQNDKEESDE